jgi:hypothetical protein
LYWTPFSIHFTDGTRPSSFCVRAYTTAKYSALYPRKRRRSVGSFCACSPTARDVQSGSTFMWATGLTPCRPRSASRRTHPVQYRRIWTKAKRGKRPVRSISGANRLPGLVPLVRRGKATVEQTEQVDRALWPRVPAAQMQCRPRRTPKRRTDVSRAA